MPLEDYIREQNAKKETGNEARSENGKAQPRMAQTKQSSRDTAEADHWRGGI